MENVDDDSPKVVIYSSSFCGFCLMAKRLLKNKNVFFENINVDFKFKKRDEMMERSGKTSVPQIFIGDRHVGGFDDLSALDRSGELDQLLGLA